MKKIIQAAAIVAAAVMMTGCGQRADVGNNTKSPVEEIVLSFPCIWVGADSKAEVFGKMVEEFNTVYDGQYQVDIEEQTDYGAYKDKIRTLISTGDAPDIFSVADYSDTRLYSESGKLMDLTDFLSSETMADRFQDGLVEEAGYNGVNYCFPYEMGVVPIMYNGKLLEEAGAEKIPTSFEELWEMCDKLEASGVAPLAQMTSEKNKGWTSMLWYSYAVAASGGEHAYDGGLDNPAFIEAAQLLLKMYDYTTSDAVGADTTVVNGHFFNERTAVCPNGSWLLGRIKSEGAKGLYDNLIIGSGLSYEGKNEGAYLNSVQAYLAAGKQEDPEREKAVQTFFEFITRPDKVLELANSSGSLFSVKIDENKIEDPIQAQIIKDSQNAAFQIGTFNANVSTQVSNAFSAALESMVLGDITPEEFVEQLKAADQ